MRAPGEHQDIDLLLRAASFDGLERFLLGERLAFEIPDKRFSHKRAFAWRGTRVELLLVRSTPHLLTDVFDGRVVVEWPADAFAEGHVAGLPVASTAALALYRKDHDKVSRAYAAFCAARAIRLRSDRSDQQ